MYAELIRSSGDDLAVVNAARVSFAKESAEYCEADGKLILYLARHNHFTPFTHVTATFRCAAPIFIARQLFKHKIGLTKTRGRAGMFPTNPTSTSRRNGGEHHRMPSKAATGWWRTKATATVIMKTWSAAL